MSDTALMSEQFNTYMTYLRKEKNTSDNTLQAYRRDISKFLDYAAENDFDSFEAVTEADMAAYKGFRPDFPLRPYAVHFPH